VGTLLGYARVSTLEQNAALQQDALAAAGCWQPDGPTWPPSPPQQARGCGWSRMAPEPHQDIKPPS
jgi:hypothetical protein